MGLGGRVGLTCFLGLGGRVGLACFLGLVRSVGLMRLVRLVRLVGCPVQAFLAAPFPYGPPSGDGPQDEHGQDHQHQQLADEQAPEQAVSGELGCGRVGPGGGEVLWCGGQFAQGEGGAGEGDAVRPGPVREEAGQTGGRPGEQRRREQEADQADQQAVGDAAGAGVLVAGLGAAAGAGARMVPGVVRGVVPGVLLRSRSVDRSACHVRPPWTGTSRRYAAGSRSGPPVAPPPAPRRGCPPGAGRPRSPRSWRGR